jgi:hypothetical protein
MTDGLRHDHGPHRAPSQCPVCSERLTVTELGCPSCGTTLGGAFTTCAFCQLSDDDRRALEVFLRSRGNLKEFQSHLGVSYPTARQRYADLMGRLGFTDGAAPDAVVDREQVLRDLAAGRITVDDAEAILSPESVDG